jgi:hypothetical protein
MPREAARKKQNGRGDPPPSGNKVRRQFRLTLFGSDMRKIMHIAVIGAICLALFLAGSVPAGARETPPADWARGRAVVSNPEGESVWQQGFFRIIYHTKGEHAVPSTDANANGVPDYVEDAATQFAVAHHIFCDINGFRNPLESERYKGVSFVDVFVNSRARLNGRNGRAFQKPERARPPAAPGARALRIRISRDLNVKKNLTPAHEYFHHIQNGTTYLTNAWFHEGTAVWSADALAAVAAKKAAWEQVDRMLYDPDGIEELYSLAYDANNRLWSLLANLCPDDEKNLPPDDPVLRSVYSDGTPVLKDFIFRGVPVMRAVMRQFAAVESAAFEGNDPRRLSFQERSNPGTYPVMLQGVRNVVDRLCRGRE